MSKNILLLTAFAQSGKDTMANIFEEKGYKHMKFAKHLKEIAGRLIFMLFPDLDITEIDWEDNSVKQMVIPSVYNKKQITFRNFLKAFGTDFIKTHINRDYHAERLRDDVVISNNDNIIISDCRDINEYKALKDYRNWNVEMAYIDRGYEPEDNHPTETSILDLKEIANYEVDSKCSIIEYRQNCRSLYQDIEEKTCVK